MDIMSLLIPIITGGVGGNVAGALMKKSSLGLVGNTIAGIVGGGAGGTIINQITGSGGEPSGMLGAAAGSLVGGGGLMAVIGLVKNMMNKN